MMHKSYVFWLLILLMLPLIHLSAQCDDSRASHVKEFGFGLNFNTLAGFLGGIDLRYSHALKDCYYQHFALNLTQVRHPKEIRGHNELNGKSFIPGKSNYLFMLRPQYGIEKVVFAKAEEQGIQVNIVGATGLAMGLSVPYVILYDADPSPSRRTFAVGQYDPEKVHSFTDIIQRQNPPNGFFSGSSVTWGGSLKAALILEMSNYKKTTAGFEIGFMADAMTHPIEIMPLANKQQFFYSTYVTLFYGWRK